MEENTGDLGERISEYRQEKGYTVRKLADIAEVSTATISELETGKRLNPRPKTRARLEAVLSGAGPEDIAHMVRPEGLGDIESVMRGMDGMLKGAGLSAKARRHIMETVRLWFEREDRRFMKRL